MHCLNPDRMVIRGGVAEACAGAIADLYEGLVPPLGAAAALGLCLLMVSGVVVRVRLRDTLVRMLPAVSLAVLNATLVYAFLVQ